jgi:hypothetical protein|tara:strand:- start:85 stop:210 length:126 start_codon:yes stop_codon:yes gene_type:complete
MMNMNDNADDEGNGNANMIDNGYDEGHGNANMISVTRRARL